MQSDGETSSPFYQVGSKEQLSQTLGLSLQLIVVIGINAIHMLDLEGCVFYTVDQYALKALFRMSGLEVYLYTHTYTQKTVLFLKFLDFWQFYTQHALEQNENIKLFF